MVDSEYVVTEGKPSVEEYLALRSAVRWINPSPETAASGLDGSLVCVCVVHDGKLVGFGRVVGDGCFTFYIQDVIVHPDHQGNGLGRAIMNRIVSYIEAVGGRDAYIGLMAARGAAGFYERFGFTVRPEDSPGMQRLPMFLRC